MGAKYLSDMTELELVERFVYPVKHRPDHFPTYPHDPMGDDPNEFGSVVDFAGNDVVTGPNSVCALVALALNTLAEQHGFDTTERPKPRKGRKKE